MKGDVEGGVTKPGFWSRARRNFEEMTDQSASTWLLLGLLSVATQAVLYWTMVHSPAGGHSEGSFGVLNSALGIIGLLALPALAVRQAFRLFFAQARTTRLDSLRGAATLVTETFAWAWGIGCFILVLLPLPLPFLPFFSWQLLTLLNTLLAIGCVVGEVICEEHQQRRQWTRLVLAAAGARLVLGGTLTAFQPWIDAALGAFIIAGFITLTPALRPREVEIPARLKACVAALEREFLVFAGATLSVLAGIYLFTNGDRIAVLQWVDFLEKGRSLGAPSASDYDSYQVTGLLARSLLWGTLPLLWVWYAERSRLTKTTAASLTFFWIYFTVLVLGAILLAVLTRPGAPLGLLLPATTLYGSTFAFIMVPLGLLQALGIFGLASRRYLECFVFGGCSVLYAVVLAWFGRRPDIMLPYMFGLALIALMIVLFVGVVRWGRKQP